MRREDWTGCAFLGLGFSEEVGARAIRKNVYLAACNSVLNARLRACSSSVRPLQLSMPARASSASWRCGVTTNMSSRAASQTR